MNRNPPHTSCQVGKRVTVILKDGRVRLSAQKFVGRTDRWVLLEDGKIRRKDIASFIVGATERVNHEKRDLLLEAKKVRQEQQQRRKESRRGKRRKG
jgi:hypothetical protein